MTQDQDSNHSHNIQMTVFRDESIYITARTDCRTEAELLQAEKHGDWYAEHGRSVAPIYTKLKTTRIDRVINVEGLQGISKAQALAAKAALIKGLRALGYEVLNNPGMKNNPLSYNNTPTRALVSL
jgi:hypothetical protein